MNMISSKEKAKELVISFSKLPDEGSLMWLVSFEISKKIALIAVDEIINASPSLPMQGDGGTFGEDIELSTKYWQDVKSEIEKL